MISRATVPTFFKGAFYLACVRFSGRLHVTCVHKSTSASTLLGSRCSFAFSSTLEESLLVSSGRWTEGVKVFKGVFGRVC